MGNVPFTCQPAIPPQAPSPAEGQVAQEEECLPVQADLIFTGGTIITMDDYHPTVEAVAVKGEKIVAVGTKDDVF